MLLKTVFALLLAVPAALAESSVDDRDTQKSYDPYRVGQLQRDAAVNGIAKSHLINRAIPSKVLSNRSTTIQRWLTVESSLQCSGVSSTCDCSVGSQTRSYQVILSVDLPACTPGPFPIVWFFHGQGGQLVLNSNSYDVYVAEAVANGYATVQYDVLEGTIPIFVTDATELSFPAQILNYLKQESMDPKSVFYRRFDFNAIAMAGHSRGAKLAAAVYADQLVPSYTAFLVDPLECNCLAPCTSDCYPSASAQLKGKDLTFVVVGSTVKGCCNPGPSPSSCALAGFNCPGSDYQEFYKYGSSESKLYLDAAGHLQYANFAIPALGLGSNVICAFNPQRSDAEVQLQAAGWMVDWLNSQLPAKAAAFKKHVPLCHGDDSHMKDLVAHLRGLSGGKPLTKTKEKIFRESQLMFVQQAPDSVGLPELPEDTLDALTVNAAENLTDTLAPALAPQLAAAADAAGDLFAAAADSPTTATVLLELREADHQLVLAAAADPLAGVPAIAAAEKLAQESTKAILNEGRPPAPEGKKKKKHKRSKYSKERDVEWLKDMVETDKELIKALKDKKWVEEVKANLKNKPEKVYIPKKDPKGELDFAKNKASEIAKQLDEMLKEQITRLHNASFFVEIAKDGVKEDVEFKKEQLKTLLIPETPKERAVDFKNDVEDLLLGTKQDLIGEWKNTTDTIVDKTTKWVPIPTPMPSPPPLKLWKPNPIEEKVVEVEGLKQAKEMVAAIPKEVKEEAEGKKEDKKIEVEDKLKLPKGTLAKKEKLEEAKDAVKFTEEVVHDPIHASP